MQDHGAPVPFTTIHGQAIQLYGQGLYRNDWFFKAPIFRGTDAVTLFLFIPLLFLAFRAYRRGTVRGRLMLFGMLSFFLYNSVSLAFGAAYNPIFLLYIAYFSASLFAFVLAGTSIDLDFLAARIQPGFPRRGIAIFMFVAGLSVFVWLIDIITGLVQGQAPLAVASYTTDITAVIDIGIIPPAAYLAGICLLRRAPLGYLLAPVLLTLNACIGAVVIAQTIAQSMAGITLNAGQYIGFVGTFVVTSGFAIGLLIRYYRTVSES